MVCELEQSPQQMAYGLYGILALTLAKGYSMVQFSYMLLRLYEKGEFTHDVLLTESEWDCPGLVAVRSLVLVCAAIDACWITSTVVSLQFSLISLSLLAVSTRWPGYVSMSCELFTGGSWLAGEEVGNPGHEHRKPKLEGNRHFYICYVTDFSIEFLL